MSNRYVDAWHGPMPCTCSTCGQHVEDGDQLRKYDKHGLQAEVERYDRFRCPACAQRERDEYAARRKGQLDAMPRCEVEGCDHRGRWNVAGVLLCGRHKSKVEAAHRRTMAGMPGGMGLFVPYTPERHVILHWAQQ